MNLDTTIIAGIIAGIIGAIATIITGYLTKERPPRLVVERIKNPESEDLITALELYRRRIPNDELCSPEDTIRWLREAMEAAKKGQCEIEEFFLVAKVKYQRQISKVCGLLYFTYYPMANPRLAFVSYLVVDNRIPEAHGRAAAELLFEVKKLLKKDLKRCQGFVTEVDDPNSARIKRDPKKYHRADNRIGRFRMVVKHSGFTLVPLNHVAYKQPDLDPSGNPAAEVPMLLMYAPIDRSADARSLNKNKIDELLDFVLNRVYGDSFLDGGAKESQYRAYLSELKQRILQSSSFPKEDNDSLNTLGESLS